MTPEQIQNLIDAAGVIRNCFCLIAAVYLVKFIGDQF